MREISNSDEFKNYQKMFWELTPHKHLYVSDTELIIESETENPYYIERMEFDWDIVNVVEIIYEYLDNKYETFKFSERLFKLSDSDNDSEE